MAGIAVIVAESRIDVCVVTTCVALFCNANVELVENNKADANANITQFIKVLFIEQRLYLGLHQLRGKNHCARETLNY